MRLLLRATVVVAVVTFSINVVHSISTGPPPASSGVPGRGDQPAEITCAAAGCHDSSPVNPDTSGKVELLGVPETYELGQRYPLTLVISHPEASRWGFQATAVAAKTLQGAGDFLPKSDDKSTQRLDPGIGRVYIEHSGTGKAATGIGQKGSYRWQFEWVAPAADVGDIEFFGVGNAADADGSPAGDKIYTTAPEPLARSTRAR